jgi:hypothetical protein
MVVQKTIKCFVLGVIFLEIDWVPKHVIKILFEAFETSE